MIETICLIASVLVTTAAFFAGRWTIARHLRRELFYTYCRGYGAGIYGCVVVGPMRARDGLRDTVEEIGSGAITKAQQEAGLAIVNELVTSVLQTRPTDPKSLGFANN